MIGEMLRLLVISTSVLVGVIAVAASIKPLSEGMLDPLSMLKFIACMAPTMLGFALPFSATFSSTLVINRMVNEREIVACRATGMSYLTIFLPVMAMGISLMFGMYYLNNWVIPRYYLVAERMLEQDMMRMIVSKVQQGTPLETRGFVLYADAADDSHEPPASDDPNFQPRKLVLLEGVAYGRVDTDDRLLTDGTAQRAEVVLFHDRKNRPFIRLRLFDFVMHDAESGEGSEAVISEFNVPPFPVVSVFRDRPRFLSWPELRRMREEPELFDKVYNRKQRLATVYAAQNALTTASERLTAGDIEHPGVFELQGPVKGERFLLSAPRSIRRQSRVALFGEQGRPIQLHAVNPQNLIQYRIEAERGTIEADIDPNNLDVTVQLELENVTTYDLRSDIANQRARRVDSKLRLTGVDVESLMALPLKELVDESTRDYGGRGKDVDDATGKLSVTRAADRLWDEVRDLFVRVTAKLHVRGASAFGCLLVTLLGAVLSLRMERSMPLVVFFWSFTLAAISLVVIHGGDHLAVSGKGMLLPGLAVIWAGDVLLLLIILAAYRKLARN